MPVLADPAPGESPEKTGDVPAKVPLASACDSEQTARLLDQFWEQHRWLWTLLASGSFLVIMLYFAWPATRPWLVEEAGLLERLSGVGFGLGAGIGTWRLRALRGRALWTHLPLPLLCAVACVDELRAGSAPGQESPTLLQGSLLIAGYPVDGVHDLLVVGWKLVRDTQSLWVYSGVALACGAAAALAVSLRRRYMPWLLHHCARDPAFNWLRLAVILILTAQILDLGVLRWPISQLLEELLECLGAVSLLAACQAIRPDPPAETTASPLIP